MEVGILFIVFISALILPVIFYHSAALIKTNEHINYSIIILAASFFLYSVFYSDFPDVFFADTVFLYYMPVFEIFTASFMIYGLYLITSPDNLIKTKKLFTFYESTAVFIAVITFFVITIGKELWFSNASRLSISLFMEMFILSYLVKLTTGRNYNIVVKAVIYSLLIFTALSLTGYFIKIFDFFSGFVLHLPFLIYSISLYTIYNYIKAEEKKPSYEEKEENKTEKIIVQKSDKRSESEHRNKPEEEEKDELIDFSKMLKSKISIYNELPETFQKVDKAVRDNIFVRGRKSLAELFIHSILSFIRNCKNTGDNPFVTLTEDNSGFYLTTGDFIMDPNDRSLNLNKVKLSEIKKNAETFNGKLTISKNLEKNSLYIRIKFESLKENNPAESNADSSNDKAMAVVIASDGDDTYNYLLELYNERFEVIRAESGNEVISKIVNMEKTLVVVSAMSEDTENEDVFYKIDKIKDFSDIPLIIICSRKPAYIELKNYRLLKPDYLLRPIDRMELMDKTEKLLNKLREHRERNIHKIEKKIENSRNENPLFSAGFDERAAYYGMTDIEKKIILLLLKGMEYKEVSVKSGYKLEDLLKIIDRIYERTGVSSRLELIDLFIRN